MVIFQYNLYIFVWLEHGCLTSTVYALDPNNSVIKRLWCINRKSSVCKLIHGFAVNIIFKGTFSHGVAQINLYYVLVMEV